ncbi:MAG: hypothetical protein M0Z41_08240 [Peptococcaceae bacterium]|nr:hypothetical protein [Peptococcaceae bacterium]
MRASNNVYLYSDSDGHLRVVGKFSTAPDRNGSNDELMRREFAGLNMMRDRGFASYPAIGGQCLAFGKTAGYWYTVTPRRPTSCSAPAFGSLLWTWNA